MSIEEYGFFSINILISGMPVQSWTDPLQLVNSGSLIMYEVNGKGGHSKLICYLTLQPIH
jgi:hypothetical protein